MNKIYDIEAYSPNKSPFRVKIVDTLVCIVHKNEYNTM